MTQLFIQIAQSVTGAVIAIAALLLVAVVIGYVTAWFYAKSIYTPVIKRLETEKADLQNQVAGLKDDITKLKQDIAKFENELVEKNKLLTEKDKLLAERDKQIADLMNQKK